MVNWTLKKFNELTIDELYAIMALRERVFTFEQQCKEQDLDFQDQQAWHLLGQEEGQLVAYLRLFGPGTYHQHAMSFGRLVVAPNHRGHGLARQAVDQCLAFLKQNFESGVIEVSAQTYLIPFYQAGGFQAQGEIYDEGGIPHQKMSRSLY